MRLVAVVCSLATITLLGTAEAKPKREHHHVKAKRSAHASPIKLEHHHLAYVPRGPIEGQSLGLPWSGRLYDASELPEGDGYVIRRPWRAFGTRTTVDIIHHSLVDFRDQFPDAHVVAVGDISQESGGDGLVRHVVNHDNHMHVRFKCPEADSSCRN